MILFFWDLIQNWFVFHERPWFLRGGGMDNGTETGVFAFNQTNGDGWVDRSFRELTMI